LDFFVAVNVVKASEELDAVIQDYEFIVEGRGSLSAKKTTMTKSERPPSADSGNLLDLDLLSLSSGGVGECTTSYV
jgi:hypothetical protein